MGSQGLGNLPSDLVWSLGSRLLGLGFGGDVDDDDDGDDDAGIRSRQ